MCKSTGSNFLIVLFKCLIYRINGKNIITDQRTRIKGLSNISTNGQLKVGLDYVGFTNNRDVTYLNIGGKLEVLGPFSIGRGCRFDIGNNAIVKLGRGSYINPFTKVIIMNGLEIGDSCAISWNCQFLDSDFHQLKYAGKKEPGLNTINIGNHVWIGSSVFVYKGTIIPNGCVIAANSVVRGIFEEENTLIAGNPAKVVKKNISWD